MSSKNLTLKPGVVYETIITTTDKKNKPNGAPMGILQDKDDYIIIRPYVQSDTFQNLWGSELAIINFTEDPKLFTYCTLFQDELPEDAFTHYKDDNGFVLSACKNNYLVVKIVEKKNEKDTERAYFKCQILESNFQLQTNSPFTRAFSLLIEILIHSSRLVFYSNSQNKPIELMDGLRKLIQEHTKVIKRVVPEDSVYLDLLEKIHCKLNFESK
ncbi:MAG: DUF447 domain-containing protein [Candidatus Heimdallarchaeota archaeon]